MTHSEELTIISNSSGTGEEGILTLLMYKAAARNFNLVMVMASKMAIAQVQSIVLPGHFNPEHIMASGVSVDVVIQVGVQND